MKTKILLPKYVFPPNLNMWLRALYAVPWLTQTRH